MLQASRNPRAEWKSTMAITTFSDWSYLSAEPSKKRTLATISP